MTDLEKKFILTMMDYIEDMPTDYDGVLSRLPEIGEDDFWKEGGFKETLEEKLSN